jgi:formate dehydrogenase major subunit
MPRLTIDGHDVAAAERSTILEAAISAGIDVPALCADPRIEPAGACRLCIVEVQNHATPMAACTTPCDEGMVVRTAPPEIEQLRRTLLRMLARDYPADAITAHPDEPFHRLLLDHDLSGDADGRTDPAKVDDSHPLIHVDLSRCISCWRCVRICEQVQGQFVWRITRRGADTTIVPDSGDLLGTSSCVSCGACVDTCPTGALEDRDLIGIDPPITWTRSTCPYCGVGCELRLGARDGTVITSVPVDDAPVNRGHLCVKGRYGHGFASAPDRQTRPLVRDADGWREVSWTAALAEAAGQLRTGLDHGGPAAVGVLGSARATNEDNYVIQKFARAVLGTNNIDCCARVCHAPSATALRLMLGTGASTNSFADIEHARTFLLVGTNTTANHPIVGARIKQAKLHGARLVVIDPRRIELAGLADVHLQPRPGTNVLVLNALAATIIDEDLVDQEFVAQRVDGLADFATFIRAYAPEVVGPSCGLDASDIRAAARLYATSTPSMSFHGLGLTEHHQGTEGVMSLVNLALLSGNLGKPGTGINPLRGQNNVQGAAHMGCEPHHLTGYAPIADARARFEHVWGAEVPTADGLDAMQMIDAAGRGDLSVLLVAGWDLLATQPNSNTTRESLGALDSLIVIDLFLTETARELATVFLPASSAFEKDGTFMNSERRVQRIRAAVGPPGDARPDWLIVSQLAAALGEPGLFSYGTPEAIWEEVRRVWDPGAGISYERLEAPGGVQWPCPTDDHPGTTILHQTQFGVLGPRASLRCIVHDPGRERTDAGHPFLLVTGRHLYGFNAGTMTGRAETRSLRPSDLLEISPDDALALDVTAGTLVRIESRYGVTTLPVEITDRVATGTVFATFHDPATAVNRLTGPHRDAHTNTPEYKITAVALTPES